MAVSAGAGVEDAALEEAATELAGADEEEGASLLLLGLSSTDEEAGAEEAGAEEDDAGAAEEEATSEDAGAEPEEEELAAIAAIGEEEESKTEAVEAALEAASVEVAATVEVELSAPTIVEVAAAMEAESMLSIVVFARPVELFDPMSSQPATGPGQVAPVFPVAWIEASTQSCTWWKHPTNAGPIFALLKAPSRAVTN